MQKIEILCFIYRMDNGGVENILMNYYERFDKNKFNIIFITFNNSFHIPSKWMKENKIELILIKFYKNKFLQRFMQIYQILSILRNHKNAILHCNYGSFTLFFCAFIFGIKNRIYHTHSYKVKIPLKEKIIIFLCTKLANIHFACSKMAGLQTFGNKNFILIKNAINLDKFSYKNTNLKNELGLQNSVVFGFVARFSPEKNHKFALEIFKEISLNLPNSHLILLGNGDLLENICRYAKKLGIENRTRFLGNIENTCEYYNTMDCLINTSFFEAFCVSLLEAQANGLKCFASDANIQEIKLLESLEFISLNESAKFWAQIIVNSYKNGEFERFENPKTKLKNMGFEISKQAKIVENLFLRLDNE